MSLADSACLACITFDDDARLPRPRGHVPGGLLRPASGSDMVLIAQHGAAFVCLACEP